MIVLRNFTLKKKTYENFIIHTNHSQFQGNLKGGKKEKQLQKKSQILLQTVVLLSTSRW